MEVYLENGEEIIKINDKIVDKDSFKKIEEKRVAKLDKARKIREDKMRKKVDIFAKKNKLEKDKSILKAYKDARSSIELKIKKGDLEKFASKNEDLIVGIELAGKTVNELSSAMISTKIDPYAINFPGSNKGSGIGIYMTEVNCPKEDNLSNYTHLNGPINSSHADRVGLILQGVSPNSYIYCRTKTNGGAELPTGGDLYGSYGNPRIYIENHSYGNSDTTEYSLTDKNLDNHIFNDDIIAFKSAGNNDSNITSPGKAMNAITVGNYDDSTDTIRYSSSYINSEIGNEKPEIVAPGTNISVIGHGDGTGTSFASPHAAGFAADLMSSISSLKLRPHLIKALMLSGATKNIDGEIDEVGLGGIDFYNTYYRATMKSWSGINGAMSFGYFADTDGEPYNNTIDWFVYLNERKSTRVVISWLHTGDYIYDNKQLGLDLDLVVYDPTDQVVGASRSRQNTYEVVEFTPSTLGTYKISIEGHSFLDYSTKLKIGAAVNWE